MINKKYVNLDKNFCNFLIFLRQLKSQDHIYEFLREGTVPIEFRFTSEPNKEDIYEVEEWYDQGLRKWVMNFTPTPKPGPGIQWPHPEMVAHDKFLRSIKLSHLDFVPYRENEEVRFFSGHGGRYQETGTVRRKGNRGLFTPRSVVRVKGEDINLAIVFSRAPYDFDFVVCPRSAPPEIKVEKNKHGIWKMKP